MQIGDKTQQRLVIDDDKAKDRVGTVIYINAQHGFFTAEFAVEGHTIRESYKLLPEVQDGD